MPRTVGRRTLTFASIDDIMPEVDRLHAGGYSRLGNWTLGQVCRHLAIVVGGSVDGFQTRTSWIIRKAVGPLVLRRVLSTRAMPEGIRVPAEILPGADSDDPADVEAFRSALGRFRDQAGPLAEHPVFGWITRDQWSRLHCVHSEHHLSFLIPRES